MQVTLAECRSLQWGHRSRRTSVSRKLPDRSVHLHVQASVRRSRRMILPSYRSVVGDSMQAPEAHLVTVEMIPVVGV